MSRTVAAIVLASCALLAVVALLSARTAEQEGGLVYSYASSDAGPGGVLALRRWLAALGYRTESVQGQRFAVPPDVDLLFVLGPLEPVSAEEARSLRAWVDAGHTLVVASDRGLVDEQLFSAFGAALEDRGAGAIEGAISPALGTPVLRDLATATARALALREAAAVLVGDRERAILAERRIGSGTLYLASAPDFFANANLRAAQNDRLVLNLLAAVPLGAVVAFDEYHHGRHLEPDVTSLFLQTEPGRALVFVGLAVFAYVALRGRRFGSPLPIEERPARSALDYVRSFAALLRRSRATELAGERLARLARRRVAAVLGVRRSASDDEVVAALARADPPRAERLRQLLDAAESARSDRALLDLLGEMENLVGEVERR